MSFHPAKFIKTCVWMKKKANINNSLVTTDGWAHKYIVPSARYGAILAIMMYDLQYIVATFCPSGLFNQPDSHFGFDKAPKRRPQKSHPSAHPHHQKNMGFEFAFNSLMFVLCLSLTAVATSSGWVHTFTVKKMGPITKPDKG